MFLILESYDEYHPTKPIQNDCQIKLRIEPGRNIHWPTLANSYCVIKRYDRILGHFTFFAISGSSAEITKPLSRLRTRYRNQIGYVTCKQGWIDYVWVNSFARKCGISTALTELCFIDPELFEISGNNLGINEINSFEKNPNVDKVMKYIKENCSAMIGLEMKADPLDGAFAYFSAAMNVGYTKMIIQIYDAKLKCCSKSFLIYDTLTAKSNYCTKTGKIDNIDGSGYRAKWYFCQLRQSPIPSL